MSTDIKLYMLQTGILKCKENNIKMNASEDPYEIPVPWYLIVHPEGNIIIDGGNAVEVVDDPVGYWGGITDVYYPMMEKEEGCVEACRNLGIDPESIKYVLQSHLHLDHTGALGRFPNAKYVVFRNEYDYSNNPDWFAAGGYIRKDLDRPGIDWQFLDPEKDAVFDLFGDGTIKMIYTPGHAVGHSSFLITLPNTGAVVLCVDAAYTVDHWEEKVLPGFLASAVDAVNSVKKLRKIAKETDALVVTGHDPDAWPSFKKAPEFYD